jgi:hypothetical protein
MSTECRPLPDGVGATERRDLRVRHAGHLHLRPHLPRGEQQHLAPPGRAVHVTPITPTLKAPVTERLKLHHNNLLSHFAFKFNSRRYSLAEFWMVEPELAFADLTAGAYTRPLFSSI